MVEPASAPEASSASSFRPCPNCGSEFGDRIACRACAQVVGLPLGVKLSSRWRRVGDYVLDQLLFWVTLGIGWLVWSLFVWGRGQTPGKQVLGMRCAVLEVGGHAGWGRTALRELAKGVLLAAPIVAAVFSDWLPLLAFALWFWLLWDRRRQALWDKPVSTIVVNDPGRALA
jgi:uncharacterized RDD family membrane protein YckC